MVYSNVQKVSTLRQAAVLADEFTLTHKRVFSGKDEPSSGLVSFEEF